MEQVHSHKSYICVYTHIPLYLCIHMYIYIKTTLNNNNVNIKKNVIVFIGKRYNMT